MHGDPQGKDVATMLENSKPLPDSAEFRSVAKFGQRENTEKTWLNRPVADVAWLNCPANNEDIEELDDEESEDIGELDDEESEDIGEFGESNKVFDAEESNSER